MSDRGPADEGDGDTAYSSLGTLPSHTYTRTHAAQICSKTNNISTQSSTTTASQRQACHNIFGLKWPGSTNKPST